MEVGGWASLAERKRVGWGGGVWSGMGAGGKVTTVKKLISRIRIDFTLV